MDDKTDSIITTNADTPGPPIEGTHKDSQTTANTNEYPTGDNEKTGSKSDKKRSTSGSKLITPNEMPIESTGMDNPITVDTNEGRMDGYMEMGPKITATVDTIISIPDNQMVNETPFHTSPTDSSAVDNQYIPQTTGYLYRSPGGVRPTTTQTDANTPTDNIAKCFRYLWKYRRMVAILVSMISVLFTTIVIMLRFHFTDGNTLMNALTISSVTCNCIAIIAWLVLMAKFILSGI
jgi:hypothetical protein